MDDANQSETDRNLTSCVHRDLTALDHIPNLLRVLPYISGCREEESSAELRTIYFTRNDFLERGVFVVLYRFRFLNLGFQSRNMARVRRTINDAIAHLSTWLG